LRTHLIAPMMAAAMMAAALTPLTTAHADPVVPPDDVVVTTPKDDSGADATDSQEADITDEIPVSDTAVDETQGGEIAVEDTVPDSAASSPDTAVVDATPEADADVEEAAGLRAASTTAVPLSAEAAAAVDSLGLSSMRLKKSNGYWVTVTPQMQANALVVMNTIQAASWAGVTSAEKDRLTDIALMTMAQESTFYTHPSAHIPDSNQDVGPFQQRSKVGWYADGKTQAENVKILNNIPYATLTFIQGHKVPKAVSGGAGPTGYTIPGVFQMRNWRTDALWEVAANVQRPATKYRYYYEYWRPVVQEMVKVLKGYTADTSDSADVYTTAGERTVNGRKWSTTCEAYSNSIDRCEARIWATTVSEINGKYVQKNGWEFNNLTYLPSARAQWTGNPLAKTGSFTSAGRSWRTSCADDWTGPNGCRSFMKVHVIEAYVDSPGNNKFRAVWKEVFNNVVRFSN
ncbi:MAG: hypothetical protein ACTHU1_10805, partial [Arachnia sp.]